jgi:sn-glycerol 3-phosphate transport system ATP-binding protein
LSRPSSSRIRAASCTRSAINPRLELQQLHRRLKTTSLYVTHDQVEAMTLAQRVMVMNKGIAEQIGTPVDVYA